MNKGHLRGFQPTKCPLRRILGETLGLTPRHLMATISGNDKEMGKILVMAEALEKWDEVYGQTA